MADGPRSSYVPALAYRSLTPLYDPLVRLTTRERAFKEGLLARAQVEPGMDVLDLGCGTGTLAIWSKQRVPGAAITGLDGDDDVLAQARAKAERAAVEVQFDEGLSFELPYDDDSYDVVLSSLFFHHLTKGDKRRTLAEVRRVLRPEGRLHIADWGQPHGPLTALLARSIMMLDGREQTADNLAGRLPDLLEEAGFEDVCPGAAFRTIFGSLRLVAAAEPAPATTPRSG